MQVLLSHLHACRPFHHQELCLMPTIVHHCAFIPEKKQSRIKQVRERTNGWFLESP